MRNIATQEDENIYRACRKRSGLSSREAASPALSAAGHPISSASLKEYERDVRVPSAETVIALAGAYGTPEPKWLHCSYNCPLGKQIAHTDSTLGSEDIYRTYFELAGAFNRVDELEVRLHEIISDNKLTSDEHPIFDDILHILDQINESTKKLKVWAEHMEEQSGRA